MAEKYTDEQWSKLIADVEQDLQLSDERLPVPVFDSKDFAKLIDHTVLKLDATESQIDTMCEEAKSEDFAVSLSNIS